MLSGGEQAKVRLCKLINRETNLLLLDEPTNHLDVEAKEELKRALTEYKGNIVLICHEPDFYENFAARVWDCSEWSLKIQVKGCRSFPVLCCKGEEDEKENLSRLRLGASVR